MSEYRVDRRTERWLEPNGKSTAVLDVYKETVEVSYELFAQMLTELGFVKETP